MRIRIRNTCENYQLHQLLYALSVAELLRRGTHADRPAGAGSGGQQPTSWQRGRQRCARYQGIFSLFTYFGRYGTVLVTYCLRPNSIKLGTYPGIYLFCCIFLWGFGHTLQSTVLVTFSTVLLLFTVLSL